LHPRGVAGAGPAGLNGVQLGRRREYGGHRHKAAQDLDRSPGGSPAVIAATPPDFGHNRRTAGNVLSGYHALARGR
jgi:hypothetical protein